MCEITSKCAKMDIKFSKGSRYKNENGENTSNAPKSISFFHDFSEVMCENTSKCTNVDINFPKKFPGVMCENT